MNRQAEQSVEHVAQRRLKALAVLAVITALLASCGGPPAYNEAGPYWRDNDTAAIPEPEFTEPSLVWTTVKRTFFDQWLELLDLDRNVRKIAGNPTPAKNTNAFDEVPNSSWFTNRHGYPATRMSIEELRTGPSLTAGPDTSGDWELFRPKSGGATPGFWIQDSRGDQYIIKFDPVDNPEMATASAAIASRFFYACGYFVPQESIVYFRPERTRIREGATIKTTGGDKRPLTQHDVDSILALAHREPDGTIRALASLNVGNVKGPFMYAGTRADDPNDWCPHQHRRELRGLNVLGSLVNHYDLKDHNSMDVYIGKKDRGYLRHYLMDFGSCFGSDGQYVKHPRKGYANMFDFRDVLVNTFTLGTKSWTWENHRPWKYPSIGYFESELFEPNKFDPIIPNPAFEQLTDQDGYWGAKIVMAFSREDLAALVSSGRFSDPEAEYYLLTTLLERREKIGHYWFSQINPLDYPTLRSEDGTWYLDFTDLAVYYGVKLPGASYRYEITEDGRTVVAPTTTDSTSIPLAGVVPGASTTATDNANVFRVAVRTSRNGGTDWSDEAVFWLIFDSAGSPPRIAGIEHPG
jgi:hypothetical protein